MTTTTTFLTAADRQQLDRTPATAWGPWRFQPYGLENVPAGCTIDWDTIRTSNDALDWIIHINGKGGSDFYGGEACVSHLVSALTDVLQLRRIRGRLALLEAVVIDGPSLAAAYGARLKAGRSTP